jgi:peptide deformylase
VLPYYPRSHYGKRHVSIHKLLEEGNYTMKILKYLLDTCGGPSDILTTPAAVVEKFPLDAGVIEKMSYHARKNKALGLAAPQVGISQRFFILNRIGQMLFVNPVLDLTGGEATLLPEGCLSFPWMDVEVPRFSIVRLKFQDGRGQNMEETFTGLLARVVQHEVDHLQGVGIWSYLK